MPRNKKYLPAPNPWWRETEDPRPPRAVHFRDDQGPSGAHAHSSTSTALPNPPPPNLNFSNTGRPRRALPNIPAPYLSDSDSSSPDRTPIVRFREDQVPTAQASTWDTAQAHRPPASPTRHAPHLRLSDTLHPKRFYATYVCEDEGLANTLARIAVSAVSRSLRLIHITGSQAPAEPCACMQDAEEAHYAPDLPPEPAPNLRDSDTVHPHRLYAVSPRLRQERLEDLNRLRVLEQARESPTISPARRRQPFHYPRDAMSYALRAYLDMPISVEQAQDLGVVHSRRRTRTRRSRGQQRVSRSLPRRSQAIARLGNNGEFVGDCRDFEAYQPSSSSCSPYASPNRSRSYTRTESHMYDQARSSYH